MAEDAGDTDDRYGTYEYLCNKYPSANQKLSIEEEELLIEQAKAGNRKAFETLLKQAQHSMLIGAWVKSGYNFPLTDEAMGAAFEKLLNGLPSFKGKNKKGEVARFVTWAVTVVKNTCKDLVKKKNVENKHEDLENNVQSCPI
jgi:DNA-directed RNA polymerase specialized sigma24 family protein